MIGVMDTDDVVRGFLDTLRGNISRAAEDIIQRRRESTTSGACWEIQMACECAFKALQQHKTGAFRETHDLFMLYRDAMPHGLSLNRDLLKIIPPWREMADLRYGQGTELTVAWYYTVYRTMLRIVAAALEPMVSLRVGKGSFKIAKAPWLEQ
jgi:HEPN domain-containing protein